MSADTLMEQPHAIRAGKTLLCSLSVLLALAVIAPAQELGRRVGDPIDVSAGASVHPEVNADVTGQRADAAGGTHHASSFGPTRNQAATSKPSSSTATSAASSTSSRPTPPAQLGPAPMPPPFTVVPSSNKLSRGAKPAALARKKPAPASGGVEITHSRFDSAASMSDSSQLNPSITSARLPHKTRKPRAASKSTLAAQNRQVLGGRSKSTAHSSAHLPKPALAK